ncbi:ABC transporter permease [Paenibacillus rhizoplanae]|uniref:ABC transporter permease n=1 Tax=Paenibacillus rhizoplanae TaxID=1917181 RepID=A0ABW5FMU4_9BACL
MSISSGRKITRIFGAELDKLVTLPMIRLTLTVTFILNFVIAAAYTSVALQGAAGTQSILDTGLASMGYLQAGFIILGILAACSEYTGGQIRTTLTVMPWRGVQLSAKMLALAMITIPAAFISAASGVLYAFIMLEGKALMTEIDTVILTLAGATGYLTLTALLSAAVGAILRRTTPAVVVLLSYYFIVSPLSRDWLPEFFPDKAGQIMYMRHSSSELNVLPPLQGAAILMSWTLVLWATAVACYRNRDA